MGLYIRHYGGRVVSLQHTLGAKANQKFEDFSIRDVEDWILGRSMGGHSH
jgi:hypothetical protein